MYWGTCKAGPNSGHKARAQPKRAADFLPIVRNVSQIWFREERGQGREKQKVGLSLSLFFLSPSLSLFCFSQSLLSLSLFSLSLSLFSSLFSHGVIKDHNNTPARSDLPASAVDSHHPQVYDSICHKLHCRHTCHKSMVIL